MSTYATTEEFGALAFQDAPEDDAVITALLERASRIFDLLAEVEPDHFAVADTEPTAKTFYGDGTDLLMLPRYVGELTAEMPEGWTLPDYIERDGYLMLTRGRWPRLLSLTNPTGWPMYDRYPYWAMGWPESVAVTVTARWGYESTPADVTQAVIALAIHLWRTTDPAEMKTTDIQGQAGMPPLVEEVAQRYRGQRQAVFA